MATATTTPPVEPQPLFAGILKPHQPYAVGEPDNLGNRINGWFDRLMLQSGLEMAPSLMLAVCACAAATLGGVVFVAVEDMLAVAMGAGIGFLLPLLVTTGIRSRRQKQLTGQLPPMIDELARAARTGRSIERCLQTVASDTPAPLGNELRLAARKMEMGLSVSESLRELPARTGLVATSVLTTALSVHEQTGGDLVSVLDRLSRTLRERAQFIGRLKAATAASRWTALLMIGLPVLIVAFFSFRDPNYFSNLMASRWGMITTLSAISLQVIGSLLVLVILSRSQKA